MLKRENIKEEERERLARPLVVPRTEMEEGTRTTCSPSCSNTTEWNVIGDRRQGIGTEEAKYSIDTRYKDKVDFDIEAKAKKRYSVLHILPLSDSALLEIKRTLPNWL